MPLYLDLVMVLNFLVDFFLLLGANRLSGFPVGGKRAALAAGLGAIYAAGCLLPGFHFLGNILWRLVSLVLMGAIAFGLGADAVRRTVLFVLMSMALGGLAVGLGRGGIPMLILAAGGLWLMCALGFRGRAGAAEYVDVELEHGGRTLKLLALRDTGNTLRDPVTGQQVLVAGADVARELLGLTQLQLKSPVETMAQGVVPGLRLIPYRAVGQQAGMLLALRLPKVRIGNNQGSTLVAFAPEVLSPEGTYRALAGGMA